MVPPQRYESEQDVLEIKSRESTRSKPHANMRSDRTTLCGDTLGQVDSKSSQVPYHRQSEGAATPQRPGASTSATPPEPPYALPSIVKFLFLWMLYAQGEAPGVIVDVALALWAAVPSACAVASILGQDLWDAIKGAGGYLLSDLARRQDPWDALKGAGGYLLSDLARPAAVSLLCFMPTTSGNAIGASPVSAPAASDPLAALVASGNSSAGAPMQVNTLCAGGSCEGSPHAFWFPLHAPTSSPFSLHAPTSSPPSASPSPANSTLSALSFCACGGEQTPVCIPAQMLPREQLVIARHCPYRFMQVQWNRLRRCFWGNTSQAAPLHDGSHLPMSSYYPVVQLPVAGTPELLQDAVQDVTLSGWVAQACACAQMTLWPDCDAVPLAQAAQPSSLPSPPAPPPWPPPPSSPPSSPPSPPGAAVAITQPSVAVAQPRRTPPSPSLSQSVLVCNVSSMVHASCSQPSAVATASHVLAQPFAAPRWGDHACGGGQPAGYGQPAGCLSAWALPLSSSATLVSNVSSKVHVCCSLPSAVATASYVLTQPLAAPRWGDHACGGGQPAGYGQPDGQPARCLSVWTLPPCPVIGPAAVPAQPGPVQSICTVVGPAAVRAQPGPAALSGCATYDHPGQLAGRIAAPLLPSLPALPPWPPPPSSPSLPCLAATGWVAMPLAWAVQPRIAMPVHLLATAPAAVALALELSCSVRPATARVGVTSSEVDLRLEAQQRAMGVCPHRGSVLFTLPSLLPSPPPPALPPQVPQPDAVDDDELSTNYSLESDIKCPLNDDCEHYLAREGQHALFGKSGKNFTQAVTLPNATLWRFSDNEEYKAKVTLNLSDAGKKHISSMLGFSHKYNANISIKVLHGPVPQGCGLTSSETEPCFCRRVETDEFMSQ